MTMCDRSLRVITSPWGVAAVLTEPETILLIRPDARAELEACCGFLPRSEVSALLPILTRHTSSADPLSASRRCGKQ
jgi:hypothetical protein